VRDRVGAAALDEADAFGDEAPGDDADDGVDDGPVAEGVGDGVADD
jgi:hypothetical protein